MDFKQKVFSVIVALILITSLFFTGYVIFNDGLSFANGLEMLQKNIDVNGVQRTFYVHLPPDYKKEEGMQTEKTQEKKFPAVLIFHGTVADANKIKNYTKFNEFADKNGIIAVYPEYLGDWDWDLRSGEKSKEIKFTGKIIDFMIKNYSVDKKKVYQTGYSSGAEISYILACSLSDKIAAFAPVAGNIRRDYAAECRATGRRASILLVHGTEDPYEKWNGNPLKQMLSVDDTLNFWKKRNACSGKIKEISFPHVDSDKNLTTIKLYLDDACKDNSEVSILKVEGGGHTWPGSPTSVRIETFLGKTNYDVSGNDVIWEFFKRHSL